MRVAAAYPVTGTGQVFTGPGVYQGCSLRNTSAGTAVYQVFDNTSAAGTLLASFSLAAGASAVDNPASAVAFMKGVFVQAGAAVEGSLRL